MIRTLKNYDHLWHVDTRVVIIESPHDNQHFKWSTRSVADRFFVRRGAPAHQSRTFDRSAIWSLKTICLPRRSFLSSQLPEIKDKLIESDRLPFLQSSDVREQIDFPQKQSQAMSDILFTHDRQFRCLTFVVCYLCFRNDSSLSVLDDWRQQLI
jgi:hypothetical protein